MDPAEDAQSHFNVVIVGAGLSGIAAARHLQSKLPHKSFVLLEARERIGGTWDLFRYPGVRSDSDMHTLGYGFRPWKERKAIADGESIRRYIHETAREYEIHERIRLSQRVARAEWSSGDARWRLEVQDLRRQETIRLSCDFLLSCAGYYRYDEGFTPTFPGRERFRGVVVHPQHWPEGFDYSGKRVVVIGSGATAVTLVPAMAEDAMHVTMLQRSPSYIAAIPAEDRLANRAYTLLPERLAAWIARWKNVLRALGFYQLSRRRPEVAKKLLRKGLEAQLPDGYDIDTHFAPSYNPWDQRLCLVPDGDLFAAIRDGSASIVTDQIEAFTETGIKLRQGGELDADVIITATGLNLVAAGGVEFVVDGQPVDLAKTMSYEGVMLSGMPNFAFAVGYVNSSWTLKVELVCDYMCRLLDHMDQHRFRCCVPRKPHDNLPERPFLNFSAGYVLRSVDRFPKQGPSPPWVARQNYLADIKALRGASFDDPALQFA